MVLIVGLGNPGKKYEKTRHNVGFRAVDEVTANFQFPPASLQKGGVQTIFNAQISKGDISNKRIILAKPQTFMNLSGSSVKKLIKNFRHANKTKISAEPKISNLIIIHDDIDLPLGKIRIVKNRGAGGHKGVESIIRELGTKNFVRFRIGIKPNTKIKIQNTESFVLKNFAKNEDKIIKETVKKTGEAIEFYLKEGLEKTQGIYNL